MTLHFDKVSTSIGGLHVLTRKLISDDRGYLSRLFCAKEFVDLLDGKQIMQINLTCTLMKGTIRGMHFQTPPSAECKVIQCIRGEVFDAAVDLRENSPTFLKWHGERLSSENRKMFVIPEGFAHGFQTMTDDCEMLYFHTSTYQPACEGGINPVDPAIEVKWPLPISKLSQRDSSHPLIKPSFKGISL